MFRTTLRVAIGALAAMAALTACGPMKMGAAAIIGDERISATRIEEEIRSFREAYQKNPIPPQQMTLSDPRELPRSTLTHLIWFRLAEEAAQRSGITLNPSRVEAYITNHGGRRQFEQRALRVGLAPRHAEDVARYLLVTQRLAAVRAPDATPAKATGKVMDYLSTVARDLGVQVSPRYGKFAYKTRMVVPAPERSLSRPAPLTPTPTR